MKKIYSLIALVAMFIASVSVSAQKYHLVQKATTVETGVTYVLYCPAAVAKEANPYANSTNGMGLTLADDSYLWQFEATGEKSDDGYDLYVIKSVDRDAYWQEVDFENNIGLDGYDVFHYAGINTTFGDITNAARVVILQAGSVEGSRGVASENDGFVISRNKEVPQGDGTTYYYNLSWQGTNLAFAPWDSERYSWQFWTVEENGEKEKLQELVDRISAAEATYATGDDPGMYATSVVEAYNQAFEAAVAALSQTLADEEYTRLFSELSTAEANLATAINPVKEGYYFIVNGQPKFYEQQGVEKAMYGDGNKARWNDFTAETVIANKAYSYLWHITPQGENWRMTNVALGTDYNGPNETGNSKKCYLVANSTRPVIFTPVGESQFNIANAFNTTSAHTEGHNAGSGKSGDIVTWPSNANDCSAWYLRTVTDQDFIDAALAYRAQAALIAEVEPLASAGGALYDKLFVVAGDFTQPLITEADDTKAPGEGGNQFVCNVPEAVEGRFAALIDFVTVATYNEDGEDTGSATNYGPDGLQAYFHSKYSGQKWPDVHDGQTPYLMVDLSNNPTKEFVLRTARRYNNANGFPTQIGIYVSNDTTGYSTGADQWTKVETLNNSLVNAGDYFTSRLITLDKAYKYFRFDMEKTNGNTAYFTLGEFNMFPGTVSEELSQYYYVDGMKEAADDMKAKIDAARKAVDEGNLTKEMIDELKAAIEAVDALFADPQEVLAEITAAEAEVAKATVGENFGNIRSEGTIVALNAAIAAAKDVDLEGAVDKAVIDKAIADIQAARKAMLEDMVVPEAGKWYQIVSNYNEEGAYCLDGTVYVNVAGNTANVTWATNTEGVLNENATAMWQFIPVEGDEPNVFYIQNMGTGLYIGNQSANAFSVTTQTSEEPIPFQVAFAGGDNSYLVSQKDNSNKIGLHAAASGKAVVGWYTDALASTWTFQEVDSELEGVVIPVVAGGTRIQTVPFATEDLSAFNEGIQFYAVKNMTKDGETTTIELYEKDSFAAGEPFVAVVDGETTDLLVAMPTTDDIVDKATAGNGLVGVLRNTVVPIGKGYFANTAATETEEAKVEVKVVTEEFSVASLKGYFDPATFTTAADAETALTFTVDGLDWGTAGDVDGDGKVNTSDVVAVYSYIIDGTDSGIDKAAADVDGDGNVTTADVVAIYDIIINGTPAGSGSNGFYPTDEGQAEMSAFVGSSDDLTKVPVTITLAIPEGKEITAFEASLEIFAAPEGVVADESVEGSVQKFLFSGRRAVVEDTDRWTEDHSGTYSKGTKEHGANSMFISIVNQYLDPFTGSEGPIITVFFDASDLAEGDYVVRAFDLLAVGTDKSSQTSPDVDAKFTVKDGKVTAVTAITAEEFAAAKAVYTLDGKKVAAPQKGQIYVVDGKAVKF